MEGWKKKEETEMRKTSNIRQGIEGGEGGGKC